MGRRRKKQSEQAAVLVPWTRVRLWETTTGRVVRPHEPDIKTTHGGRQGWRDILVRFSSTIPSVHPGRSARIDRLHLRFTPSIQRTKIKDTPASLLAACCLLRLPSLLPACLPRPREESNPNLLSLCRPIHLPACCIVPLMDKSGHKLRPDNPYQCWHDISQPAGGN